MKHPHQKISVHKETGRFHVETINNEKSMTQQQFQAECDVNNIMKKYVTTGEFTHHIGKNGTYADFSSITDYHDLVNTVTYAQEAFALLPANVRQRFKNDPGELLAFIQDDKNYDEAIKLGLMDENKTAESLEKREKIKKRENSKTAEKNIETKAAE